MIIASDTSEEFPVPDGHIREFLRSFGLFGVVLVNCNIEHRLLVSRSSFNYFIIFRQTTTEELFPTGLQVIHGNTTEALGSTSVRRSFDNSISQSETLQTMMKSDFIKEPNVMRWNCEQVVSWLTSHGLTKYTGTSLLFHSSDTIRPFQRA